MLKMKHFVLCFILSCTHLFQIGSSFALKDQEYLKIADEQQGATTNNVISVSSKRDNYVILLNAGSTGTRLSLFKIKPLKTIIGPHDHYYENTTNLDYDIRELLFCEEKKVVLHEYTNSSEVGQSLDECMSKAEREVPDELHAHTPIFLIATAGMRLLEASCKTKSDERLDWVRSYFNTTRFLFSNATSQVRIIDGWEEGMFALLAMNYRRQNVKGALQMGGASAQLTFVTDHDTALSNPESPFSPASSQDIRRVAVGNSTYSVYSHSYLCRGMAQMVHMYMAKSIRENDYTVKPIRAACLPIGYSFRLDGHELLGVECTNGTVFDSTWPFTLDTAEINRHATYTLMGDSDPRRCREEIYDMVPDLECPFDGHMCGLDGVFQPKTPAFDFIATNRIIRVIHSITRLANKELGDDIEEFNRTIDGICSKSFNELKIMNRVNQAGLTDYDLAVSCFQNSYIVRFLEKLGFSSLKNINLTPYDPKSPMFVRWVIGFLINKLQIKDLKSI